MFLLLFDSRKSRVRMTTIVFLLVALCLTCPWDGPRLHVWDAPRLANHPGLPPLQSTIPACCLTAPACCLQSPPELLAPPASALPCYQALIGPLCLGYPPHPTHSLIGVWLSCWLSSVDMWPTETDDPTDWSSSDSTSTEIDAISNSSKFE